MLNLRSRGRPLLASLLVAASAACDIPTESPTWDTLWVVAGDSVAIQASSFFPSGVTEAQDGGSFALSLPSVAFSRTLGEMCGAPCQTASGLFVPKPAFTASFSSSVPLPADVVSASITGGSLEVRLSHNLSFDPIRPSATARGYVKVTASSGSLVLASDSVSGNTTAFSPGTTLTRALTLAPGAVAGPVTVTVTVGSPAGGTVRIDNTQRITVTTAAGSARATEAQVRVQSTRTVQGTTVELGTTDDSDRVEGAALQLETENPFGVTGTLSLVFRTSIGETITKSVAVGPGTTRGRVELTRDETRTVFQDFAPTVTASAVFSAPGGTVTLRPRQTLRVRSKLELTIRAGS